MSTNIPETMILNQNTPEHSAKMFIDFYRDKKENQKLGDSLRTLHYIVSTNNFWFWNGESYEVLLDLEVKKLISDFLKFCRCKKTDSLETVPFVINKNRIEEIFHQVRFQASEGTKVDPFTRSTWNFADYKEDLPDPKLCLRFKNKILCIDQFVKSKNPSHSLLDNHCRFFSSTIIPYEIDPSDCGRLWPVKWLSFLEETFNGDQESIQLLQQWFGYCMAIGDLQFQKMMILMGPSRSGKGVISRVLKRLMGDNNTVSPKISSFKKDDFVLEGMLGKNICIIEDARYDKYPIEFVEFALSLTGEDNQSARRKHKTSIDVKLPCKLMIISNDMPKMEDASTALSNRYVVLKTHRSVKGREDFQLFDKLIQEIPKIVWWALEGLLSLYSQNKFIEPESRKNDREHIRQAQSPILHFVEEMCNLASELSIPKGTLYNAYESWCNSEGITCTSYQQFANVLMSNCDVDKKRANEAGTRIQTFVGISLKDRS